MLKTLSRLTCRVSYGAYGAVELMRREGSKLKDALATFRLLASPHTEGLTVAEAIAIVEQAAVHKLDPFDVWMLYDQDTGAGVSVDRAVLKALEMRMFFQDDPLDGGSVS